VFVHMYRFQHREQEHTNRMEKNMANKFAWIKFSLIILVIFSIILSIFLLWYFHRKSKIVSAAKYSRLSAAPYVTIAD
jgi:lipopolysaccharide/colanic/teichoic acid biosynthesis glycosyltransferase